MKIKVNTKKAQAKAMKSEQYRWWSRVCGSIALSALIGLTLLGTIFLDIWVNGVRLGDMSVPSKIMTTQVMMPVLAIGVIVSSLLPLTQDRTLTSREGGGQTAMLAAFNYVMNPLFLLMIYPSGILLYIGDDITNQFFATLFGVSIGGWLAGYSFIKMRRHFRHD